MVPYGQGYVEHIRDNVVEAEEDEDKNWAPDTDDLAREFLRLGRSETSEADHNVAPNGSEEDLPEIRLHLSRRAKADNFVV